jgi:hypothetical protein
MNDSDTEKTHQAVGCHLQLRMDNVDGSLLARNHFLGLHLHKT